MPIYEYLCAKCGIEFELRRSFSEVDKPARCPKCNSKAQKLVSGFASKTGSSIQPPGKPFRKTVAEKASKRKKRVTKATRRQSKK
jgi:putative FmdB family regulatory protein